jgi:hypothetical protein
VDVDMEFKAKQKLAEIEKYQEEFNKTKETVVDDETEDEIQKDEEGSTNEDIDESKEQNGEVTVFIEIRFIIVILIFFLY